MRISDWSSDVCSSDLHGDIIPPRLPPQGIDQKVGTERRPANTHVQDVSYRTKSFGLHCIDQSAHAVVQRLGVGNTFVVAFPRSEERRVGKECVSTCRSRWSPYHYNKIKIQ